MMLIEAESFAHSRAARQKRASRLSAEDEPEKFGVEEKYDRGDPPGQDFRRARVYEPTHFRAVASELNQGNDGKGQLKAENHLAENDQGSDFALACYPYHQDGRSNGQRARDEPAKPRLQANIQKAFHDDLAGERAGKRGVLSRGQQRARENGAGQAYAKHRAEQFVGVGYFRDVVKAARVKRGGAQDENCRVYEESEGERESRIKNRVAQGFATVAGRDTESTRLHDAGMQIEIVRHYGGAKN